MTEANQMMAEQMMAEQMELRKVCSEIVLWMYSLLISLQRQESIGVEIGGAVMEYYRK